MLKQCDKLKKNVFLSGAVALFPGGLPSSMLIFLTPRFFFLNYQFVKDY